MANLRTNNLSGEQGQNAIRGSVFFDGTGDKLSVPNSADVRLGSNDFTMEAWVKFGDVQGYWDSVLGMYDESADRRTYYLARYRSGGAAEDGRLYMYVNTDGTSGGYANVSGGFLSINDWHHVAGVRNGNTLRVYINGVQVGSSSFSGTVYNNTTDPLFIGDVESDDNKIMNGFISNVRLINGTCIYPDGTTFTPPQQELTLVPNTVLLACQNSDDVTQEATGKTITAAGNLTDAAYVRMQPKVIPPYGVDAGNVFGGTIQQSSQGYMYFPTGRTEERGGSRGILAGGFTPSEVKTIDFFNLQSTGNALAFGNLTDTFGYVSGYASHTRAVFSCNYNDPAVLNTLEFITIATQGNSTDFGDRTVTAYENGALSNETRGLVGGGYDGSGSGAPNNTETIDFNTIASLGNSTDFGDLTLGRRGLCGLASPTRGVFAAGYQQPDTSTKTNVIDFVTIASTGNASNFGDLVSQRWGVSPASSATRGIFAGGASPSESDSMEFITIASTGDTTDFGDLTQDSGRGAGTSDSIRGVFKIGYTPSTGQNTLEFVTIATTGNASDFGDSVSKTHSAAMTSNAHGGLS